MKFLEGIKPNVLALGFVSFLTDVSSEMVFPILPLFLTGVLGAGKEIVGLVEGIADSITSLLDIFIGYWSDSSGERKKFVLAGYGLSSLCKFGFAFATSWPIVLVARGAERLGKSIRTSPRDAIIAQSTDEKTRGKAFGLHRAMDTAGAVLGPIIAYFVLLALGNGEQGFRAIFYIALIPAFLAVLAIWLFVKEPKADKKNPKNLIKAAKKPKFWEALRALPGKYRNFVLVSVLFSFAYFSFALLILRASELGIGADRILLLYILYNVAYLVFSVPAGMLSDKIGRKPVIAASFALYAAVCIGFAMQPDITQIAFLFALYGFFVSADESVNKAYVADMVGKEQRGMALGAYNSAVGAAYLPANAIFGFIWAVMGAGAAFGAAAGIAGIAAIALLMQK